VWGRNLLPRRLSGRRLGSGKGPGAQGQCLGGADESGADSTTVGECPRTNSQTLTISGDTLVPTPSRMGTFGNRLKRGHHQMVREGTNFLCQLEKTTRRLDSNNDVGSRVSVERRAEQGGDGEVDGK
jgi:hypothetical protein